MSRELEKSLRDLLEIIYYAVDVKKLKPKYKTKVRKARKLCGRL